jgi:hypothetical protein
VFKACVFRFCSRPVFARIGVIISWEYCHGFRYEQGSPIQFNTRNARKIVASLLKNDSCADILGARGDSLRFGLRVKVFAYAENVCAVWVMLAVKYKPVE